VRREESERGQGLVEFTLAVPIIILVLVSVAEIGLALGNSHTIGYGSREGARVGSALANGDAVDCTDPDPAGVDKTLVAAVQRILKSPGSGIDISRVQQIRIFRATASGQVDGNAYSTWVYVGEGNGAQVDPDAGYVRIDFDRLGPDPWPACSRVNSGPRPDSIGVTVDYEYRFVTPLPQLVNALTGGALSFTLSETTVMSLNPSV